MTSLATAARHGRTGLPPSMRRPLAIAAIALLLLLLAGIMAPAVALHGWLIGFVFAGGMPLGALALLLIHGLTGGRWGEAHRPALVAIARPLPALVVLVLPLVLWASRAYPWAADPSQAGSGVAAWYLNAPAVLIRSLLGLGLLAAAAWRFGRESASRARIGVLGAALWLCIYAVFINAAAYDWLLSLAPRFTASAFGAQIIVAEMLAALCCVVLASGAEAGEASWADLGGLMLAMTLGESYFIIMSVAINWYGDLPVQADWYMRRSAGGWAVLEGVGALLGAVLPMLALLFARVRRDPVLLRVVAGFVLAGLAVQYVWLVSPGTEALSGLAGIVGVTAVGGTLVATGRGLAARQGGRHGD